MLELFVFGNCTKVRCKQILLNLQKFLTIFEIILSTIPCTSPTVHNMSPIQSLCNVISTHFRLKLPLSYIYFSSANMDSSSYKETWMYYKIYDFFAWMLFPRKNPIIIYQWIMHFSQMPTYYDRLSSYSQSKCSKSRHSPMILHWVPMLAYQAHVA